MKQSNLVITTFLSLFVIFGLIGVIKTETQSVQRGRGGFKYSSKTPETVTFGIIPEPKRNSTRIPRKPSPTAPTYGVSEASKTRARIPTFRRKATSESDTQKLASSTRQEVIYQNDLTESAQTESRRREESRRGRSKVENTETKNETTATKTRGRANRLPPVTTTLDPAILGSTTSRIVRKYNRVTTTPIPPTSSSSNEIVDLTTVRPLKIASTRARGTLRPRVKSSSEEDASEENYPEEFKQLIRAKKLEGKTANNVEKPTNIVKARLREQPKRPATTESTSTSRLTTIKSTRNRKPSSFTRRTPEFSSTSTISSVFPTDNNFNIASTSRQPSPFRVSLLPSTKSTKFNSFKQVQAPTKSSVSSTNSLNFLKQGTRVRSENRNIISSLKKSPKYTPTVPSLSTPAKGHADGQSQEPTARSALKPIILELDINDGNGDGVSDYDIIPIASGLSQSRIDVETSNHSPSVTVSIFSALSEILSQTTESLKFLSSTSTDSSVASTSTLPPSTTTSTTTTTTTTTTTPKPIITTIRNIVEQVLDSSTTNIPSFQNTIGTDSVYIFDSLVNNIPETTTILSTQAPPSTLEMENNIPENNNDAESVFSNEILSVNDDSVAAGTTVLPDTSIRVYNLLIPTTTNQILIDETTTEIPRATTENEENTFNTTTKLLDFDNAFTNNSITTTTTDIPFELTTTPVVQPERTTLVFPIKIEGPASDVLELDTFTTTTDKQREDTTTTYSELASTTSVSLKTTTGFDLTNPPTNAIDSTTTNTFNYGKFVEKTTISTIQPETTSIPSPITLSRNDEENTATVRLAFDNINTATTSLTTEKAVETTTIDFPNNYESTFKTVTVSEVVRTTPAIETTTDENIEPGLTTIVSPITTTFKYDDKQLNDFNTATTTEKLFEITTTSTAEPEMTTIVTSAPMTVSRISKLLTFPSPTPTQTPTPMYIPRFASRLPVLPIGAAHSTTWRPIIPSTTQARAPKRADYVVYGILSNNTVVKRIIEPTTSNPLIVYGLYPNGTLVRRYPNGTIVADKSYDRIEITNIDPKSLQDPNSEIYRDDYNHNTVNNKYTTTTTTISTDSVPVMSTTTIIDLLRKYNSENQSDTRLKSDNVFSLAMPKSKSNKKALTTETSTNYLTLDVDPSTNQVRLENVNDSQAPDVVYRWRPVPGTSSTERMDTMDEYTDDMTTTENPIDNTVPDNILEIKGFSTEASYERLLSSSTSTTKEPPTTTSTTTLEPTTITTTTSTTPIPTTRTTTTSTTPTPTTTSTTTTTTLKPTTTTTTTTTTTPMPTTTTTTTSTTTTPKPTTTTTSTTRAPTTSKTTRSPQNEFLENNLRLLSEFLAANQREVAAQRMRTATKPTTTSSTTTTTTTPKPTTTTSTTTTTTTTTTPKPTTTTTTTTTTPRPITTQPRTQATSLRTRIAESNRNSVNSIFVSTTPKVRTTTFSDNEDLAFLSQLARFLSGNQRRTTQRTTTRRPTTTTMRATTTPRTTTTTTTTSTTPRPTSTTRLSTIISDVDDVEFLNSLRALPNLPKELPVEDNPLANRILQLALNRGGKSVPQQASLPNSLQPVTNKIVPELFSKPVTVKAPLSRQEVEKTQKELQKELQSYNNDIKLLSTLLGRPISDKDIPSLTKQIAPTTRRTTTSTTTTTTTTAKPQVEILQELLRQQQQQHNSSPASVAPEFYGKSNEAVLAAILKQRGIGPSNTNAQIEDILAKLSPNSRLELPSVITTTRTPPTRRTTIPPFQPIQPARQGRPILDGLSWLWQQWQATDPRRQRTPGSSLIATTPNARQQAQKLRDEGLDPDALRKPLDITLNDDAPSLFGASGGVNPGGQLLNAAIGVTRAVTQFLGVALQGAAKQFTGAFRTGADGGGGGGGGGDDPGYYRLSGR